MLNLYFGGFVWCLGVAGAGLCLWFTFLVCLISALILFGFDFVVDMY